MRQVMVRYKVHPNRAEENARLITDVFDRLHETAPAGLTYSSYRLDDGVTFVHIASVADADNSPLRALAAFNQFTADIKDRCEEPPVTTVLHEVGSYTAPLMTV